MDAAFRPRIGLSLLSLGNRSGTGFYTERLFKLLCRQGGRDLELVALISTEFEFPGRAPCNFESAPEWRLRWPFRIASQWVAGGFLKGLDAVHYPNGIGPPVTRLPVIATLHDVSPFLVPETLPAGKARFLRQAFRETARVSRRVIADTYWQAEKIAEVFPQARDKIRIVYPSADPIFASRNLETPLGEGELFSRRYLLSVGTLEPRKGILELLEAWREADTEADLYLVGRWGWKSDTLKQALAGMGERLAHGSREVWGLPDGRRVRRLGFVEKDLLALLYQRAVCLVYPSRFEGFGLPVLEAMMAGCPVATRPDSAMEEVAGKCGWYYRPEEPGSLQEILMCLDRDSEERRNRIEVGRARARQWGDREFYEGILEAYRETLED